MSIPLLSKSKFVAGIQCPLRLWYQCYEPELATPPTPAQQAIFDMGTRVGELARDLYPGGALIEEDHLQHDEAIGCTGEALNDASIPAIYEAAFTSDGVRIRADILERTGNGSWNLMEVKSGVQARDHHFQDAAVQYHVLSGLGLDIEKAGILHLNNKYVYDGHKLNLEELFTFDDLTTQILDEQTEVSRKLEDLKSVLRQDSPPAINPSRHCRDPYGCEFYDHCRNRMPEHWILQLSGIGKGKLEELARMGISDILTIPGSFDLKGIPARIRKCVVNQTEYVGPDLKSKLIERQFPIHFLDFETISPAIPRYANTRPYQTLPFQWSDHILSKEGSLDHKEYLCTEDKDPREEVARALLDTLGGDKGDICNYANYEKKVISDLANHLPKYRDELETLADRCWDLCATIRKNYYHPEFHGSSSLKKVLPAVVSSMSFSDLAIQEGEQAGVEYLRMIDPETPPDEKERIHKALLEYCGQDTLGMVKIWEELLKRYKV